jgi:hypothetical protein
MMFSGKDLPAMAEAVLKLDVLGARVLLSGMFGRLLAEANVAQAVNRCIPSIMVL